MSAIWDLILIILSSLLPPLGVFFKVGIHHEFWITILLTILGYLPGIVYAWYIILSRHRSQYYYAPRNLANVNANVPQVVV